MSFKLLFIQTYEFCSNCRLGVLDYGKNYNHNYFWSLLKSQLFNMITGGRYDQTIKVLFHDMNNFRYQ